MQAKLCVENCSTTLLSASDSADETSLTTASSSGDVSCLDTAAPSLKSRIITTPTKNQTAAKKRTFSFRVINGVVSAVEPQRETAAREEETHRPQPQPHPVSLAYGLYDEEKPLVDDTDEEIRHNDEYQALHIEVPPYESLVGMNDFAYYLEKDAHQRVYTCRQCSLLLMQRAFFACQDSRCSIEHDDYENHFYCDACFADIMTQLCVSNFDYIEVCSDGLCSLRRHQFVRCTPSSTRAQRRAVTDRVAAETYYNLAYMEYVERSQPFLCE